MNCAFALLNHTKRIELNVNFNIEDRVFIRKINNQIVITFFFLSFLSVCWWNFMAQAMGGSAPFVWYHNGRPLMDGGRSSSGAGTVHIYLDAGGGGGGNNNWTTLISRLEVARADPADSGNYTCAPWRGKAASVSVFISQGRKQQQETKQNWSSPFDVRRDLMPIFRPNSISYAPLRPRELIDFLYTEKEGRQAGELKGFTS